MCNVKNVFLGFCKVFILRGKVLRQEGNNDRQIHDAHGVSIAIELKANIASVLLFWGQCTAEVVQQ